MSWPLISDFSRMLQNPQVAFRDPDLRTCKVEMDHLGQPKARSGNFATVYRGYREDESEFAIRVFNRQANLRRETYQAKHDYLESIDVASLVEFQFDEKGIRASDGKLYPLLIMEWVPGTTLYEWARDRCREGYQEALSIAADVWLGIVRELARAQIVHGDLQHGNIMVSNEGHIKLVDYDCMAVPALLGQENFEIGMVPYQHPQRDSHTQTFLGLDNFSSLVIYVALRALAAAPYLWTAYVDNMGYDKLLFRKEDFQDSENSSLYQELLNSPDEQVRDLAYYLFQLVNYPIRDVPNVDEVILWSYSLEDLIRERDWDRAVQLTKRMGPDEQIPSELQQEVARAVRRVKLRDDLEQAYEAGSEWRVQELYDPNLLDDYPAAESLVAKVKSAPEVVRLLEQLSTAKRFGRWDAFRQIWNNHHELLNYRPSAKNYKLEMKKIRAADAVASVLANESADPKALLRVWRDLQALGGHPLGEPLENQVRQRVRADRAADKIRKWLRKMPTTPTAATDRKLASAWSKAGLTKTQEVADLATRYDAATQRLGKWSRIREIAAGDPTLEGETEIVRRARELPDSYHSQLPDRLDRARRRLEAYRELTLALESPRSDRAIDKAWREAKRVGAAALASDNIRRRAELAAQRVPLIDRLGQLDPEIPPDTFDARLLEIWDESLLKDSREAQAWTSKYELAKARKDVIERIQDAIVQADFPTISSLSAEDCLKDFPLPSDIRNGIDEVQQKATQARRQRRQQIVSAVTGNDRTRFVELFDTELVREICSELPHHQTLLSQFVEEELLPAGRSGLAAHSEGGLQVEPEGKITASWHWPPAHISRCCRVAVCREKPGDTISPDEIAALWQTTLDANAPNAMAPLTLDADPDWEGAHLVVWAVIDLGFHRFYTVPLDLGQLEMKEKKRKRRLFG